jgi:prevent-host-death family protein
MTMPKNARRAIASASLPKGSAEDVAAAEFKAKCLELMDRVKETGAEYVITKHGRPVAKLVPYTPSTPTSFFGSMKGTVLAYDRPFEPLDGEYDLNLE